MHCKKCGKAIGTDRGICPFCGAMLSKEQYQEYQEMKKSNNKPELLTEKYGEKPIIYEKRKEINPKLYMFIIVLGIIVLGLVIALIFISL